jgi:hypothetical protein
MSPTKRKIIYALAAVGAVGAGVVHVISEINAETFDGGDIVAATQYAIAAFVSLLARANVDSR